MGVFNRLHSMGKWNILTIGASRVSNSAFTLNSIESSLLSALWPSSQLTALKYNALVRSAFAPGNFAFSARPFFYFQHVLSPHPPFSLTAEGKDKQTISPNLLDGSHFVRQSAERRAQYIEGYVEAFIVGT